ncbi:hypothetical protein Pla108_06120 [Botrimarina colliarenosi]|uniref:Uncharacterized protein n=1 Tax=Botrimarina colliarenosi TaxID=2528001 RepID=A0A5C6AJ64_9BACT|nr:AsmA-like C-terminal region-containing protein [Botrimarina colliarenosi]TWT99669.1 hypothetical protein Pla108_06120 [Botrimarina colliarenosi]
MFRGVLTLVAVLAAALAVFLYFRLDDEAQRLCEAALNRHCEPSFVARVGAARYTPGQGVTMYNVEIVERLNWRPPRGVLQIDELHVQGQFDVASLMRGKPVITRIVAKAPRLAITKREDGTWNVADFQFRRSGGAPIPRVDLQNATVLLTSEARGKGQTLGLHHLHATIDPVADSNKQLNVVITARDTIARTVEARGVVAADGSQFRLEYKAEGVQTTSELMGSLAHFGFIRPMALPLRGAVSFSGEVSQPAGGKLDWRTAFNFAGGEARLAALKRPLTEVKIVGEATPGGLRIDNAGARWGDSVIRLAGRREGWGFFAPLAVRCRMDDFDLAATPTGMLPAKAANAWQRFRPLGRADVAVDVSFDGRVWAPRATITARDASFEDAEKFPYRLTNATGQILVNGGVSEDPTPPAPGDATIDVRLQGQADGAPVVITAAFHGVSFGRSASTDPPPKMPPGWVEVAGNSVPISERLVAAIPDEEARRFVESLHPTGRIDVRWRAERINEEELEPAIALNMRLVDCRMLYDRFPYPLSHVTGWIEQRGKEWKFYELRSRDTQGRTLAEGFGSLEPREGSCRFDLQLSGEAAPLDQTLYDALPENAQQAWTLMRPRGQIDFVADIARECGQLEPTVRLKMTPHQQNLAVEPPLSESGNRYRLERVDGDFYWADDRLTMQQARAEHGRTIYMANGAWEAQEAGAWKLDLTELNVDRLDFNRDFLLAAPAGLRAVIEEIEPQGAFGLFDSRFEVTKGPGANGPVAARWRVGLNCHQASLNPGVPIDGVSGVVRLSGQSDGASATTAGELDLDSLFWNDLQLTQVRGPIWADGSDCFLGEGAARKLQSGEARTLQAKAYGGAVELNSWIRHGGQTRYGLAIGLNNIDVTRLSTEWLRRPETLHGSLDGQLKFQGVGASIYGLTGEGALEVNDADLYELPLFLSLLKYLRNRAPDNTAFNQLSTKFRLEGNDIHFENFDLKGDAVSLYGRGTATLQRDVDLTFASIVGRTEFAVPVLKAFVSSASEQLLRLRVVGPIDSPEVRREVLPAVGNVFEQLQSDLGARAAASNAVRTPAATRR